MVQALAIFLGALYCFTWLRIPQDVIGQILPAQRLISWLGLIVIFLVILFTKTSPLSSKAKTYIGTVTLFLAYLLVDLMLRLVASDGQFLTNSYFDIQAFISDFAKYLGSFSATFLIYFALKQKPQIESLFVRALLFSGTACMLFTILFVVLFYAGFTTDNEILAPTFGGVLGVWPAGGIAPRLAGTTAEPQQFSIVFLTPMFLMLTRQYIRKFWPVALVAFFALFLSQSKFALLSVAFVFIYVFAVYKPYRSAIALVSVPIFSVILYILSNLPVYTQTFAEGFETQAIAERGANASELLFITFNFPFTGIGIGQYTPFINWTLGFELFPKGYYPSLDYLKILGETGLIGFLLVIVLLLSLLPSLYEDFKYIPDSAKDTYLAFLLGGTVILLSMFFSYEFLHAIFWINLGYLVYAQDHFSVEIERAKHERRSLVAPEVVELPSASLNLED